MSKLQIWKDIIIPILIFIGGVLATIYIGNKQISSAKESALILSANERSQHDETLKVQLTSQLVDLIKEENGCEFSDEADAIIRNSHRANYATELWKLYEKRCPKVQSNKKKVESIQAAENLGIDQLITELEGGNRHLARINLTSLFNKKPNTVSNRFVEAIKNYPNNYRINLGILVVLGSIDGAWDSPTLKKAVDDIKSSKLMKDKTFEKWYDKARKRMM